VGELQARSYCSSATLLTWCPMSAPSKRPRKPVNYVDDADGAATGGVSASASEGGGPNPKRQKRKKKAAAS
jgi:hypothetical protein